ncbi:MAG: diguanylate cyclase [Planctomycetales bacterium]|nr:diguanylate cyclase [Planctomycetales bacterium]NIM09207.1 diguanylate cyclase [Planctomycetales bacterium]NIN08682.1 diguanylate cyclase [Planctomycetales bacterium]NIN77801.1 diguanylate cyclase [Planctomycetales bacterium]NIO34978.1 diguanylate cyclase [Planctomycetales bacterium]
MNLLNLLAWIELNSLQIPLPITLACACVFSYLIGRVTFKPANRPKEKSDAVCPTSSVPKDLQQMAGKFQQELKAHQQSVDKLAEVIGELKEVGNEDELLMHEVKETLKISCRLAAQLSCTNEEMIRRVSKIETTGALVNDPVTGQQKRDALEESLRRMFAMQSRYELPFSVVSIGLDSDAEGAAGEGDPRAATRRARRVAELLSKLARESDIIGRYDADTFIVLLPNTTVEGAILFGERALAAAEDALPGFVSAGVAMAGLADDPGSLLQRAIATQREAKATIVNAVYYHDGNEARPVERQSADLCFPDEAEPLSAEGL